MITLDNFENFVPYKIWMRGEEYYETDAVSELEEISPGEWTATVEGTDDYNQDLVNLFHCMIIDFCACIGNHKP